MHNFGAGVALEHAAENLARCWKNGTEANSGDIVRKALNEIAVEQAGAVREQIESLARTLVAAMQTVPGPSSAMDEFDPIIREIPQIDLGKIDVTISRPMIVALGRRAAHHHAKAKLRAISSEVEAAFASYSRLLQAWMRRALRKIVDVFESHAGTMRAQLDRRIGHANVSPETRQKILEDLADL